MVGDWKKYPKGEGEAGWGVGGGKRAGVRLKKF